MELELHTLQPFNGRLYAREQPNRCETLARGNTSNRLRLPLPTDEQASIGECGVRREPDGRYSAIVVVQQHPLVQRKGDRLVRVVCSVHGHSQVVSSGYQLLSPPPDTEQHLSGEPATTLVNGSAPAAQVQLRITDANGNDVMGARLGQQLQLRIERSDASEALHMQATHLLAMSSSGNQQIALIDADGYIICMFKQKPFVDVSINFNYFLLILVKNRCPTDSHIFPSLEVLADGRTLIGRFDAFKFADDQVVRFRVNVHFCVGPCKSPQCDESTNVSKPNVNGSERNGTPSSESNNEIQSEDDHISHHHHHRHHNHGESEEKHDRRSLTDRTITIESSRRTDSSTEDAADSLPKLAEASSVSLRAAVARLFSRRKRSESHSNGASQVVNRRHKRPNVLLDIKPTTSALRTPADAELKREIIVQGLSNNDNSELDNSAKLLYNQSKNRLRLLN